MKGGAMEQNALAQRAIFLKQFDASISHELVLRALNKLEDMQDAGFYFQKAEEHRLKCKYALAISYYEKSLKINPDYEDALFFLGWCYLGNTHKATGAFLTDDIALPEYERNKRAALAYKRLIKILRETSEADNFLCSAYYNYSLALFRQNRLNETLDILNQAIALREDYGAAYSMRAFTKLHLGLYSKALKDCEHAAFIQGEDEHYYNQLGAIHSAMGNSGEAIESFLEAIDSNPEYVYPYMHLNEEYRKQEEYDQALEIIESALEINPQYPDFYYFHARTDDEMGNAANAAVYYSKFLQKVPARAEWFKKHVKRAHKRLQELQRSVD